MFKVSWLLYVALIIFSTQVYASNCRVIEYPDRNEVVCTDTPPAPNIAIDLNEEKEKLDEVNQLFEKCKKEIEHNLKSPSTAIYNFTDKAVPVYYSYGDKHMNVTVDAQNGYGAMIRGYYTCSFDSYLRVKFLKVGERP